jgi:Tfp pilus assembly protein PilF
MEKALGVHHPDTLRSVSNLAAVLQYQGKYDKAEKLNRRALEGRKKELGVQ